ncbi:MAG: hypothetical protein ACKO04_09375, partial [Actinomycetes bacterium]
MPRAEPPTRSHQLRAVRLGDESAAWRAAGFTVEVRDDGTGAVQFGRTVVELSGSGAGFEGWALDEVDQPLDGLPAVDPWGPPP